MRHLCWIALLVGCTDKEDPLCAGPGATTQAYVVSSLKLTRRSSGVVQGFDLDGLTTAQGEAAGCGHADFLSPEGVDGIDNNFSALVPILEITEASATESLIAQSIASGELLITLEVTDVDTWMGDSCIDFTLGRAEGVPLVGPDGILLDHQTLARSTSIDPVNTLASSDDRHITSGELAFQLPLDVLNAQLNFEVTNGIFSFQKRYDGALTGLMGGSLPIQQIVEILERPDVNLQAFVPIVRAIADLQSDTGECDGLSFAFEIEAIPVFLE